MKKLIVMMAAAIAAATMPLMADTWTDAAGYTWSYCINGDTAEIFNDWYVAISPSPTGSVTIPSSLGGKPVTNIGNEAFCGCSGLTNVTIPGSVTSIGDYAFEGCSGLTSVTIPNNVASIGDYAFAWCYDLTRAYLPRALEGEIDESSVFYESPVSVYYYDGDAPTFVTVTLNANGGNIENDTVRALKDNVVGILPEPTYNGHTFLGWFTAANGGDEVTEDTVATGNMTLYAHWEEITYTYSYIDNGDGTVSLSYHYDEYGNWINPINPSPVGDFEIPAEIDGKLVVTIDSDIFNGYGLTSVSIPASVTNLTVYAFYQAYDLTNITVAADNPAYKDIDGILYTKDGRTLVCCPHGKSGNIVVASGTERIGEYAFYNNYNLTSASLPDGLKVMESYAFAYCQNESLTSVTIPASVETIGSYAFGSCSNLDTVTFAGSESGIDIAATAFIVTPYDASKPFSLIIENEALVGIHGSAPETLDIADFLDGQTLTGISSSALSGGSYNTSALKSVVVPEGVTWIYSYAFAYDYALESVTLPESLQYISNDVFDYCTSLREIRIPSRVTYVEDPFWGCENLTVHAPDTLEGMFSVPDGCTVIYYNVPRSTVTLDANGGWIWDNYYGDVATLDLTVFEGDAIGYLPEPYMYDDYRFLGWYDANGNLVTSETIPTGNMTLTARWAEQFTVTFDANGGDCDYSETAVFEEDEIGWLPTPTLNGYMFLGWFTAEESGDEVTEDTVVTADMTLYAHWDEISYTYSYIDNGDGTVSLSYHYDNEYGNWINPINPSPVGDFEIPAEIDGKSVVAIDYSFMEYELTSVVIPASVTNLTVYAFWQAYGLTNITVAADNPAYKDIDGILYTKDGKTLVYCPYRKGGDIVVASGTECIGVDAFYCNSLLTSVSFPEGLEVIGDDAFTGCWNIEAISVPSSVETIGAYAFRHCSNLATVNFLGAEGDIDIAATAFIGTPYDAAKPFALIVNEYGYLVGIHGVAPDNLVIANYLNGQTLTGIDGSALSEGAYDTSSMTNVVVPEGVIWIGNHAFAGDSALASVTLPTSLQYIYYDAFGDCSSLRTITIPSGVTYVEDPFWGCENLTVYAPETLRDAFSVPETCTIEYYTVPQHTVTFNANGGMVDGGATAEWTIYEGRTLGSEYYELPTPTLNGYMFLGWFTAEEGGDEVTEDTVVTADMTVYAMWTKMCTVTFDANGGYTWFSDYWGENWRKESSWISTVAEGEPFNWLPSPENDSGARFLGWIDEYGNEVTSYTVVTNDMTLTAQWEAITYTYNYIDNGDGTVTLSYHYDEYGNWINPISPYPVGDFEIPAEIDGKTVVTIDSDIFNGYGLTSVSIPASVTNIAYNAFDAYYLTNITVAADNPAYKDIDGILYTKDGTTLVKCPTSKGGDIMVAAGTERIGQNAFYNNYRLTSISLPDGLKVIDSYAFGYCGYGNFISVMIPASVETIGSYAFYYCHSLATVTFAGDESVIAIAATAFVGTPYNDNKPFSLIVENGTLVGFHGVAPETLDIADYLNGVTLTSIGYQAFSDWSYDTSSMTNVVVPEGVIWIGNYAFASDSALESVTLPASLQSIGYGAFNNCTSLRTIFIPSGVTSVSDPFYGCENLTVYAPETLEGMFSVPETCSIEYYEIPKYTVTFNANGGTIDGEATYETTVIEGQSLGSLPTPSREGYDFIGWFDENGDPLPYWFAATENVTFTAFWIEASLWNCEIVYLGEDGDQMGVCIYGAKNRSVVTNGVLTIPSKLTAILDDGAVVELPVVEIGDWVFESWAFDTLVLPASIVRIGSGAFSWCYSLTTVSFTGNMNDIYMDGGMSGVFYGTPWLNAQPFAWVTYDEDGEVYLTGYYGSPLPKETIVIPNDVSFVYSNALPYFGTEWDGEKYRRFLGWYTAAEGGDRIDTGNNPWSGGEVVHITSGTTLYAHWEDVEPEWYFDIEDGNAIIYGNSVSLVGDVEIPASVSYEEDDGVGGATVVSYPVTVIGDGALGGMEITSVTIPASVTNIQDGAFESCANLTNVVFAGGMENIEMDIADAFYGTPWLEAYLASLPKPDNDDFADATPISGESGRATGTNMGASIEEDEPLYAFAESAATVWWRWTAPKSGSFTFTTEDSNFDTTLGIYTGNAVDELETINEDDDGGNNATSAITFDAVSNTTYYIAVGGYDTSVGNIVLNWGVATGDGDVVVEIDGEPVTVSGEWIDRYSDLLESLGCNIVTALNATAANGKRSVAECYVLGVDPEDPDDDFKITSFEMVNGEPVFTFSHTEDGSGVSFEPRIRKLGKANLGDLWQDVPDGGDPSFRFFTVEVDLP